MPARKKMATNSEGSDGISATNRPGAHHRGAGGQQDEKKAEFARRNWEQVKERFPELKKFEVGRALAD